MTEANQPRMQRIVFGAFLVIVAFAVFAIRLQHAGDYAIPTTGVWIGSLGALGAGAILLWPGAPKAAVWVALAASPIVLFISLYATMAEVEEVISIYAVDSAGSPADLRLWVIDREDGAWVGMPRSKSEEHSLDGAELEMLRAGEKRCVVLTLYEDRPTVTAIHRLKVEKYAVARGAALIGVYPREARETTVVLRLDDCAPR